jgi:hypothetical protein
VLVSLVAAGSLGAQTVRGTVLDAGSGQAINEANIVMLNERGTDTVAGPVRTDDSGHFILYAADGGNYQIRATRLGYAPVESRTIALDGAEVAMLDLKLSAVPAVLGTVAVTSRRALSASELMSPVGFDQRMARNIGAFIGSEELRKYRQVPVDAVLRDNAMRLSLRFGETRFMNEVVFLRQGVGACLPEVRLDGNLVANEQGAFMQRMRTYNTQQIHGIEAYRASQLPPPRLAGDLGVTAPGCGVIAIWTRAANTQMAPLLWAKPPGGP